MNPRRLREMLIVHGYSELAVGAEHVLAVELLPPIHKDPFDRLLLTDVVMPGMNGRELHEKAVQQRLGLKVLYMSGYTDNVIVHRGILEKGGKFIQKPFSVKGLAAKVREVLEE